ncbi:MAG: hypothetical protein DWQ37_06015 [Planctomycetota bacterium]|nr:MAG: hypothetical protein DWQ37_06015 [Planctomycetota bacterium]
MKTERRHELQTNVLADSLARGIEAIKPYGRGVLAVVIILAMGLIAWFYTSAQGSRRSAEGWTDYLEAMDQRNLELMQGISQEFAGSDVGHWARMTAADWLLADGTNRLLTDQVRAKDNLKEAREEFAALLLDTSNDTIQQRATYGLAQADEALGDLEKARSEYRTLAEKWPEGPFHETAEQRAEDLDRMSTKQFYDWLARYEPPAASSGDPGIPGVRPDFMQEPDAGTLQLPSSLEDSGPLPSFEIEPTGEAPSGEEPAAEPSGEEPAAEAPAEDDAPAESSESGEASPEPESAPAEESKSGEPGPEL